MNIGEAGTANDVLRALIERLPTGKRLDAHERAAASRLADRAYQALHAGFGATSVLAAIDKAESGTSS